VRRPRLEVADVFHRHGADWRRANAGHVSLAQLQVMSAIERCRSAALGGHVERCEDCGHSRIAYNSCLMGKFCNGESAGDPLDSQLVELCLAPVPLSITPAAFPAHSDLGEESNLLTSLVLRISPTRISDPPVC